MAVGGYRRLPVWAAAAAACFILIGHGAGAATLPGESIYRRGVLSGGSPVDAVRGADSIANGSTVACVNCHRRSGLGSSEGTIRIPPITAAYLFKTAGVPAGLPTLSAAAAALPARSAYTDESLARAIREGVGRGGRVLDSVMPRYSLSDSDMAALIAYLKALPVTASPGASETTIDFATIVTPDADPAARDAMLAVLDQFVQDKNAFLRGGKRPLQAGEQINFRVTRRWQLHVWSLQGPSSTWERQLDEHLKSEPVFAVLSGIGRATWAPVHHFCNSARLPCLFPNIDLPIDAEQDFYSFYFSKGALLDAELIAVRLAADVRQPRGRLVQVYVGGDPIEEAVRHLAGTMGEGIESVKRSVRPGDAAGLARAVGEARAGDVLVLWLRPEELRLLSASAPKDVQVFASGTWGGFEQAPLPAAWRSATLLTYPIDQPASRAVRLNYPLKWMQIHHVPVVAEKLQADTYLACGVVSEALGELQDSFMRDYLLERIESMLSHRQLSGYYPRLSAGPGQRFVSKGGYLVRLTQPGGLAVTADGDWLVP